MSLKRSLILLVALLSATPIFGSSYYTTRPNDAKAVYLDQGAFSARGDGVADDTDALQQAINKAQETTTQGIVFIPTGRYRVSRAIYVWPGIRLIGFGAQRPVFVLAPHALGFQQGPAHLVFFAGGRPQGFQKNKPCGIHEDGRRHYCIPKIYQPMPSWLFHNNGDGTFIDVSKSSGIASHPGKAWGVVATDINNDGWMDLFVSNDTVANFLFVNNGKGKFTENGTEAGVAYSANGKPRSGMGLDSADFNEDGWQDLFVANLDREDFAIYRNNRDGTFDDLAVPTGIARATRAMSGWGLKFFDYDNDGNLDLLLANGNPDDLIKALHGESAYEEPLLLFHGNGKSFEDVSAQSGPVFTAMMSSRGLAIGDFDNDGALDVLISVNNGAPLLLRNNSGKHNHWLGIHLIGEKCNPDAVGARITWQAGDLKRSRMKVGGGSYLSSHDPRIVLGLGNREKIDWIEVKWPLPGGDTQRFMNPPADRYITIIEGEDKWK